LKRKNNDATNKSAFSISEQIKQERWLNLMKMIKNLKDKIC
jgi:hypothetical protein